jgi:3-oxoacyl-[acyl-carrier protein] reductase
VVGAVTGGTGDIAADQATARVALVTGANRGLGLAIARRFRDEGYRVAGTYRSEAPDEPGIAWVRCDVSDTESVESAFAEIEDALGPVEVLVSNAGMNRDGLVLRMSDDDFASVLDANLHGTFRVARRAAKRMVRSRFGRMIFISSVVGQLGQAGQANYAASKAGLVGLARSLARELASRNVCVNVVAPGPLPTDMIDALTDEQREAMMAVVPLGRFGDLDEVAATVVFLASDTAGYITGAIIPVDGGLGMG